MDTHPTDAVSEEQSRTMTAWEEASRKYVSEYAQFLDMASTTSLNAVESATLGPLLAAGGWSSTPQGGHGVDDAALVRLGATSVIGVDDSRTAVDAAQRRADELALPCRYLAAE